LIVWSAKSGEAMWEQKFTQQITAVCVHSGLDLVLIGGAEGCVSAWSYKDRNMVWADDQSMMNEPVLGLAVSDKGPGSLFGAGKKGAILAWQADSVHCLDFDPSNLWLLVGTGTGVILAISPSTGIMIRSFRWHYGDPCICEGAGMLVSAHLNLAFAKDGPLPPSRTKTLYEQLASLQKLGLSVSAIHRLQLHVDSSFVIAFGVAATAGFIFICIVLFKDFTQQRAFVAPESRAFQIFKTMTVFCKLTARVAFLPIARMLLLPFVCIDGSGAGLVVRESQDIACGHWEHVVLCGIALLVGAPFAFFAIRLASVDFALSAVEINRYKPWDISKDSPAQDRLRMHPLTSKNAHYDTCRLVMKLVLILNELFLVDTWDSLLSTSVQVCGGIGLLVASWLMEPCFPNQVSEGRLIEPNSFLFALDALITLAFMGNFLAALSLREGLHAEIVVQWLQLGIFPLAGLCYWLRKLRGAGCHLRGPGAALK